MMLSLRRRLTHWGQQPKPMRLIFALVLAIGMLALFCGAPMIFFNRVICRTEVGDWYPNPSGGAELEARVETSDCGALSGYYSKVIVRERARLHIPGTYDSQVVFEGNFPLDKLTVVWESGKHLAIEYPVGNDMAIRDSVSTWKSLTVTHRPRDQR